VLVDGEVDVVEDVVAAERHRQVVDDYLGLRFVHRPPGGVTALLM
jgi:hypothetical protein